MDKDVMKRERDLELLEVDDQIAERRMSISQKKAIEKEMRAKHGRNWRQVLGLVGKLRVSSDSMQDLYSVNPELRDLSRPGKLRRL